MSHHFCLACLDCKEESDRMNHGDEGLRELRKIYSLAAEPMQVLSKLGFYLPVDCLKWYPSIPDNTLEFLVKHHKHNLVIRSEYYSSVPTYSSVPDELFFDRSNQL